MGNFRVLRNNMTVLKTVFIFIMLGISIIIVTPFGLLSFLIGLPGLQKPMRNIIYRIVQGWASLLIALTGCDYKVSGRENIPKDGGLCFVSNHCGFLDILLILASAGRPVGFIAKKELALVPLINIWILLIGGLYIDRKSVRKSFATINKGVKKIRQGGSILIFPEGHRSKGRGLLPFHPGSFKLATQSEAPIIPAAITGSYEVYEKTRLVHAKPVRLVFGKPINTAEIPVEGRRQALSDTVYAVIADMLADTGREMAETQD
jgi:1-acyl-sn-glycerol-3-phosphate acyltransferase